MSNYITYNDTTEITNLLASDTSNSSSPQKSINSSNIPRPTEGIDKLIMDHDNEIKRYSSREIINIANQSVDDLLSEIQLQQPDVSLTSNSVVSTGTTITTTADLVNSPLTQPLNLDSSSIKSSLIHPLPVTPTRQNQQQQLPISSSIASSLNLENSEKLARANDHQLGGPRSLNSSPSKTPKKVKIEMSPPKVVEYDVQSEYEEDEISVEEAEKLALTWNAVPVKLGSDEELNKKTKVKSKPLPPIIKSASDYSVKSMPNLPSDSNLLETSNGNESDDSEQTIAFSPRTQNRMSFTEDNDDKYVLGGAKTTFNEQLKQLELTPATNLNYDHEAYMEQSRRGELPESDDIKINKKKSQQFKNQLSMTKAKMISEQDQIIEDLGDLYESNVRNTVDSNSLHIKRSDSVKSAWSINSGERLLSTKTVNKPLNSIELRDGIQGFTDDAVKDILDNGYDVQNNEQASRRVMVSDNESDIDISHGSEDNSEQLVAQALPKTPMHQHTRSTSLSEIMGKFFRSMSNRSISESTEEADEVEENEQQEKQQQQHIKKEQRVKNSRRISTQSIATSITNESDFVSADEGDYDSDEISPQQSHQVNFDNLDLESVGTIEHEDTFDSTSLLGESTQQNSVIIRTPAQIQQLQQQESQLQIHKLPEEPKDDSMESNDSFASHKFVLTTPFEDDLYNFSIENVNELDAIKSRVSSGKASRVSSETSEKEDVLAIWSTQDAFANLPRKRTVDRPFQSICDPVTKFVVSADNHPKTIRVISEASNTLIPPSDRILSSVSSSSVGSTKAYGEISHRNSSSVPQVEASFIADNNVEQPVIVVEDGFAATIERSDAHDGPSTVADMTFKNPLNDSTTIDELTHKNSSSEGDDFHDVSEDLEPAGNELDDEEENEENKNIDEDDLNPFKEPVASSSRIVSDNNSHDESSDNSNNDSLNRILAGPMHISLDDSDGDDSFLKELKQWEDEQYRKNNESRSIIQSNDDALANVWRRGTISPKKKTISPTDTERLPLPHMTANEMEAFINHKRMTSDDFQIKNAGSQGAQFEVSNLPEFLAPQQKGLMVQLGPNNETLVNLAAPLSPDDYDNENDSVIIPQLGISTGIEEDHENGSFAIYEDNKQQANASKYGHLVPQSRLAVSKAVNPLSEVNDKRLNSGSIRPKEKKKGDSLVIHEDQVSFDLNENVSNNGEIREDVIVEDSSIEETKVTLVNGEQGRLFLRFMGLKGLRIPELEHRNPKFQIVLDNGIHRLTTNFFKIDSPYISIEKEFELMVAEKLDLIITLKLSFDKLREKTVEVRETKKIKSKNKFARAFGIKETYVTTKYINKAAGPDPMHQLVAPDGSFAKFIVNFDNFKDLITGESKHISVDGMNEWRIYKDIIKNEYVRAQPYKVCTMDFNMLFVPRTSPYEVLPISIKNADEQLNEIKNMEILRNEGYMFQEGGDTDVWTRRYFKLEGYDLIAHNEITMKVKAKINLKRVVEVIHSGSQIDDEDENDEPVDFFKDMSMTTLPSLNIGNTTVNGHKKNKSRVISETLIMNEGFRLRFSNNETIDFGCDSASEKSRWISIFNELIVKNNFTRQPWVKLMMEKSGLTA